MAPTGPIASLSNVAPDVHTMRMYTTPVIMMDRNVPFGIAFCGSCNGHVSIDMRKCVIVFALPLNTISVFLVA